MRCCVLDGYAVFLLGEHVMYEAITMQQYDSRSADKKTFQWRYY